MSTRSSTAIAIVGMACQYPDAHSPIELWENALARRRAFRRMPDERLRLDDYYAADPALPDRIYTTQAALLADYEFDRMRYRVAGPTFRSADFTHWLALDVAASALEDAGFPDGDGLVRETTGVILGNTLTGEFSRAATMRLRWPYVRRVVDAALVDQGWSPQDRTMFLDQLEPQYKAPFPSIGEESLAGGLANTIAGRICNYFDLKGGGYTVDGACASSLLAITGACKELVNGDLDVALTGGVDLSLDPFELIGFAKTSALAPEKMRVYDERSAGFWPGEGCGFLVLMRHEDAVEQGRRVYALIKGWGVSSDGSGGITRPEKAGQRLSIQRAYKQAGYGIDTVAYFEGHGTGTAVGDATELRSLSSVRRDALAGEESNAERMQPPAVIGSIKANIGHTKAAAGVAGLIKATLALHTQELPPNTGVEDPHPELTGDNPALRVLAEAELWPGEEPLRAGVSAMGFGGINTHITLEGIASERRVTLDEREQRLLTESQEDEIFLISAPNREALQAQIASLLHYAGRLSRAELTDLAAALQAKLSGETASEQIRAALVADTPATLATRLETLQSWLADGVTQRIDTRIGLFLGQGDRVPHFGLLFPGQGASSHVNGGALRRRFPAVAALYGRANLPTDSDDTVATSVAQPAIVTASLAALTVLKQLGIEGNVALGHSLGELTALHWAGAYDEGELLQTAAVRGRAMMELGDPTGAMASISTGEAQIASLFNGNQVSIACLNAPRRTVISGRKAEVAAVVTRAQAQGLGSRNLAVSHAFHSPLVADAVAPLAAHLDGVDFRPLLRPVISTITGSALSAGADLKSLLCRQVTEPVRYVEAVTQMADRVDILIEVGPGYILSNLADETIDIPSVAMDAGGASLKGVLFAVGAAFALGAPINHEVLFADRFTRPFDLNWTPKFLVNPCELAPISEELPMATLSGDTNNGGNGLNPMALSPPTSVAGRQSQHQAPSDDARPYAADDAPVETVRLLRQVVADRIELPIEAVRPDDRLLSDLHLNSITVTQIVTEAARQMGIQAPVAPNEFANVTVANAASALDEIATQDPDAGSQERYPAGVDGWVRAYTVEWEETPMPTGRSLPESNGSWHLFTPVDYPLRGALIDALAQAGGGGVAVCLPPDPSERDLALLLEGAQALFEEPDRDRFLLVQHSSDDSTGRTGAAAAARTLHLEEPSVDCCVVDLPMDRPDAVTTIVAEVSATDGYNEVRYDADGRRLERRLHLESMENGSADLPLGADDVLLVSGGGKGITAECALSLARESGARLALLGRSLPEDDAELAANLGRLQAAGVVFRYFATDVTDEAAVRATVQQVQTELGPITALLHGAARNAPKRLRDLAKADIERTFAPKVGGMRNLLAAIDGEQLKLVVAFGSIIARTGLPGEADYGLANDWLAGIVETFQAEHPHCRTLTIDWSVWAGAGMGERLGALDGLVRQGITPISLDDGVAMLRQLLAQPAAESPFSAPESVIVTGRYGDLPTLRSAEQSVPFWRFLEQVRVHYPGVELVVDAALSGEADPYMDDHVFQGERLFLAVLGMEAMAQAAMALAGEDRPPLFEAVELKRPVVVPVGQTVTIRLAALVREEGIVEVALRSEETGFQVDHFRAVCNFKTDALAADETFATPEVRQKRDVSLLKLDPASELYGSLLFHSGRFRRVRGYREIHAGRCLAELTADDGTPWFSRFLPGELVLGDPGARDATIHCIQVCVPQGVLLPVGVERFVSYANAYTGPRHVHVQERPHETSPDSLIFDVVVTDDDGDLLEEWQGLRLTMVSGGQFVGPWAPPVMGAYLERQLRVDTPNMQSMLSDANVVIGRNGLPERQVSSDQMIQRAVGANLRVMRRPDGKPEVEGDWSVSAAHAENLVMAVARPADQGPIACDMEPVESRPRQIWDDLLGVDRMLLAELIAQATQEKIDTAATRVWAAVECLKKGGVALNSPLTLASTGAGGRVTLMAGSSAVNTSVAQVMDVAEPVVFAVYG